MDAPKSNKAAGLKVRPIREVIKLTKYGQITIAGQYCYALQMGLIRFSICALLLRIFTVNKGFRKVGR